MRVVNEPKIAERHTVSFAVLGYLDVILELEAVAIATKLIRVILAVQDVHHILNHVVTEVLVRRPAQVGHASFEMVLHSQVLVFRFIIGVNMA